MNTIKHKPLEFETMEIGGQIVQLSVKTADRVRRRREVLAKKNRRISRELKEAGLLPNSVGSNGRHAKCITPSYTVRKRDKTTSETRQAIIHGQNIARKNDLDAEWQKMNIAAFKI